MLPTSDLEYDLPQQLIAARPAEPRDDSRLLVVSRSDESTIEHRRFRDLPDLLRTGDLLITNRAAVIPARITGRRVDSGGKIEGLFLAEPSPGRWRVMLRSNGRLRPGQTILLTSADGADSPHTLVLHDRDAEAWLADVRHAQSGQPDTAGAPAILDRVGAAPLPPYILAARRIEHLSSQDESDRRWYQTVYADRDHAAASVAAPTAGLHFTPEVLDALDRKGVQQTSVVLDVGLGTFKPITAAAADEHPIHTEHIHIPPDTVAAIDAASSEKRRRICVGTTSVCAVESLPSPLTPDIRARGLDSQTSLYILPGFEFAVTDALITNFHLPRSTLLALVAALLPGGVPRLLDLYRLAIAHQYRFYSFGDAMLILP